MCGIAGLFSSSRPVRIADIRELTSALRHRGPDDEGYLAFDPVNGEVRTWIGDDSPETGAPHIASARDSARGVLLGHRRLSIIDPSLKGHQPLGSGGGRYWVVYNGEIYNYRELRALLAADGYSFHSGTDTEVLIASYMAWGERCVDRFNGMWSFALLDIPRKKLFCSRDRFGVKPFFYHSAPDLFAFASEIKALLRLPGLRQRANPEAVYDYLVWGVNEPPGASTFLREVSKLPPGHNLTLDLATGEFSLRRYYELPYERELEAFDERRLKEHSAEIRERIFEAVKLRLRADVALGSCLSGGVDSSTVVLAAHALLNCGTQAGTGGIEGLFTACYPDERIDESAYAERVAVATGAPWFRVWPTGTALAGDLADFVRCQDEPCGSTSMYAQYRVMRRAREQGIKVLLDGQGGDELFTGYTIYYHQLLLDLARKARWPSVARELVGLRNAPVTLVGITRDLLQRALLVSLPSAGLYHLQRIRRPELRYLRPEFAEPFKARADLVRRYAAPDLNTLCFRYMSEDSLPALLRYEDRNSMAWSIEARTPFADDVNLIESVFRIPGTYKIHDGWSKYLLRSAASDLLPPAIRDRRDKLGFATPEKTFLADAREPIRTFLEQPNAYFDSAALSAELERVVSYQPERAITRLWKFVNLATWLAVFDLD